MTKKESASHLVCCINSMISQAKAINQYGQFVKVWVQTTKAKKQNDFNSVEKSAVETVNRLAKAKIAARDAAQSRNYDIDIPPCSCALQTS